MVLDTSVAIAWCIEEETTPYTEAVLLRLREETGVVPPIWPLEVGNALLAAERRGRIEPGQSRVGLRLLAELPITVATLSLWDVDDRVLRIARDHGLSSYDAPYVELALRRGLPLATLDARMRAAAAGLGVPLVAESTGGAGDVSPSVG